MPNRWSSSFTEGPILVGGPAGAGGGVGGCAGRLLAPPSRGEASPTAVGAWSPLNGATFYHALLGLHLSRPRADAAAEASFTGVGGIAVDGAIAVLRHETPRLSAQGVMPAAFGWVSMRWKEGHPLRWNPLCRKAFPSAPQGATDGPHALGLELLRQSKTILPNGHRGVNS